MLKQTIEFITVHTSTSYTDALAMTARQCLDLANSPALKAQFKQQEQQWSMYAQGINALIKTIVYSTRR